MLLLLFIVISVCLFILYFKTRYEYKRLLTASAALHAELSESKKQLDNLSLDLIKSNNENSNPEWIDGVVTEKTFDDRLLQAIQQNKRYPMPFSVMLLSTNLPDLQENKAVIVQRIQSVIREVDTVTLSEIGVFKLLFPQISKPEDTAYIAQRLLDALSPPIRRVDEVIEVKSNLGVVVCPLDGSTNETLNKNAEAALVQAQAQGGNSYKFYQKELDTRGQKDIVLNTFLRRINVREHLTMQFVPVLDIKTNKIECIQAIPMLTHPEIGEISYADFIRTAEASGKIQEISDWMFTASLKYLKQMKENPDAKLLLKLSLAQFEDAKFIDGFCNELRQENINFSQIILEIAGSNFTSRVKSLEKIFLNLTSQDIKIAMGIFGLGNLALQNVTKLTVNYLIIDNKLVQDTMNQKQNEGILHTLISVAKGMNVKIIAEGVDNKLQKSMLESLGCEIMQGKLFDKVIS